MKRRDFFTKLALTTAAVAVAPGVLSQEPGKALSPYRNVLNNPYYQWVRAKRSDVHVRDNNYWRCLEKATQPWDEAMEYSRKLVDAAPKQYTEGKGGYISLLDPPLIRMYTDIQFREYDWVYEGTWPIYFGPVTPQAMDGYQKQWMNIEDYDFFRQLSDLNGVSLFDFSEHRLLGVGLIPGLINPINPGRAFYKAPQYIQDGINRRTISPIDAYEIHIIYQKIK